MDNITDPTLFPSTNRPLDIIGLPSEPTSQANSLIFIDSSVENWQQLVTGINNSRITLLDPQTNGIKQITETLAQHQDISSLHIVSHGSPGEVFLGQTRLNLATLPDYARNLQNWANSLTRGADILFYGCNMGYGRKGVNLIETISQLTGADINASDDLTGSDKLGGDWDLEVSTGTIETPLAFSAHILEEYTEILPFYNGNEYILTDGAKTWEEAQTEALSRGGNLVTINDAAEETWLKSTFGGTEGFWIGLNDRLLEGQFEWVNGEVTTYRNWAPGEPNNARGNQDYGSMNFGTTGQWDDNYPTARMRGIIEIIGSSPPPTTTYLSDLTPVSASNGWGVYERDRSNGELGATDGRTQTLNGVTYGKGLGVHAASELIYTLNGQYDRFRADVGVDDEVGSRGSVVFQVYADGTLLYDSGLMTGSSATGAVDLDLTGRQTLRLVVTDGGDGKDFDHANWANARLLSSNTSGPESSSIALESNSYTVNEAAGRVDVALVRSGSTAQSASVLYRAQNNTALAGSDFTAESGTLTFAPGETRKIVSIPILNDTVPEVNELFNVVIDAPTGASLGTIRTATVTVIDDDSNVLSFSPLSVSEAVGTATITVTRGNSTDSASVDFGTRNVTATAGLDYRYTTGRLTFAPGETIQTISIPIYNNTQGEANEVFDVIFSNPQGVALGSPSQLSVTIIDDDNANAFIRESFISGLTQPTSFARTPDNSLMFILEKSGMIKVAQGSTVLSTPFADLTRDVNNVRDRGALSIAVHPNFYNGSPYIYVAYTYDPPEAYFNTNPSTYFDNPDQPGNRPARVVRLTADASSNYTRVLPNSQVVLIGKNSTWANTSRPDDNSTTNFSIPESGRTSGGGYVQDYLKTDSETHSVGHLAFGADGMLYFTMGDGTSYNRADPRSLSVQSVDSLSGKMLRVDPLTGQGLADNPFYNGDPNSNRSKVWNLGWRNPFRFTMKPGTNTPYVGDVGWYLWEEVNVGARGANYGWPGYEGNDQQPRYAELPAIQEFYRTGGPVTAPIFARSHIVDGATAIIMGDFYDGDTFPSIYQGALFIADVNGGGVDALTLDSQNRVTSVRQFASGLPGIVYMETGPDDNLYYVNLINGEIGRWRPA